MVLVLANVFSVAGQEVYDYSSLIARFADKSNIAKRVELENKINRRAYQSYLENYKELEDGIEKVNEMRNFLDEMIDRTIQDGKEAKEWDEEILTITLGELEGDNGNIGALDYEEVRIVNVNTDNVEIPDDIEIPGGGDLPEDIEIPDNILDLLPDDIKDQIPDAEDIIKDELEDVDWSQIDVPEFLEDVEVTIGIDSKAYYMKMVLPELMNRKGEAKSVYDELIQDKQLEIYVEMETLKMLDKELNHVKQQETLKETNDFKEVLDQYAWKVKMLETLQYEKELMADVLDDEDVKESLGISTINDKSMATTDLMEIKKEEAVLITSMEELSNIIKYQLDLSDSQLEQLELSHLVIDNRSKPLDFETFKEVVHNQSLDIATMEEQLRVYDNLEKLAQEVYVSSDYQLHLITSNHDKVQLEYNKLLKIYTVLIEKVYADYSTAYTGYDEAIALHDKAKVIYNKKRTQYELGLLSERENQVAELAMMKEEVSFLEAGVAFNRELYKYMEAMKGIMDTSHLTN